MQTDYLAQSIVTVSGRIVSGIVRDSSDDELRIVTADKELPNDQADIEERRQQKKSIMPDGQEKKPSPREFVDLLRYLQSLI